jgi:Ethanolamine utilization protein EutJ (predicted chaperonin)
MNRRTLLRASALAIGGGGAGAAVVAAGSDDATGQTALTLDVAGDSATLGADERVTAVRLSVDVEWAYDLPDTASPESAVVEIAAGTDSVSVVDSAESAQLFTEADGTESFDVDLLDAGALEASALAPESGERETEVTVEARLRVESSDGSVLARETATDTAPVTVERDGLDASAYGSVGGEGELTIETG